MLLDSERSDTAASQPRRRILSGIVAVTATLAGCLGGDDTVVEIQHHSLQEGPFNTYVTGGLKNVKNNPVDATVTVTFLDGDGEEMGTESESNEGVPPNELWNFEVTYGGDDVDGVSDYEMETEASVMDE